ncbi:MAG: EAL domain-containing protein [Ruminiclostridium sp.]|nr:EAL domain-containing protein [Ruminiclostridium sp.]
MDRIAYLDFVAIPIYIVILYALHVRKMIHGTSNRIFRIVVITSLICSVGDLIAGMFASDAPLSGTDILLVEIASGVYHLFHGLLAVLFLLFLLSETRNWYWASQRKPHILICAPYFILPLLLIINLFTGFVFTVDANEGYRRGPGLNIFYVVAAVYMMCGVIYLFRKHKVLKKTKLFSLLMMYVCNVAAVVFQMLFPIYLVEMIMTAIAELFVVLLVLRPEDYLDYSTGMPSFKAYSAEVRKICGSKAKEKIVVMRLLNAAQLRRYLGEDKYFAFIRSIAGNIKELCLKKGLFFDMYFEQPGRIYLIIDNYNFDFEGHMSEIYQSLLNDILDIETMGARIIPRFCEINYPDDIADVDTILNVGHQFHRIVPFDQLYTHAGDIVNSQSFRLKNNMDLILNRAIKEKKFEMYYQPIYSIKDRRFISAEALIRLKDEEFGFISPALFIPAAERKGLMIPIGDFVLESVFRFISENDFSALGLSYIELNLSVAQCLQGDLSDKILALEKKYHVNPARVNLEITETTYENMGEITNINIKKLSENGFSFSLDDYGTGYSNMHRISRLPLKIIKIDKTMVDDMENSSGMSVMKNTVTMMKDIRKEIVCEGVETEAQLECLSGLGVDFIQGYFFSKPLPESSFIAFIKEHNIVQV